MDRLQRSHWRRRACWPGESFFLLRKVLIAQRDTGKALELRSSRWPILVGKEVVPCRCEMIGTRMIWCGITAEGGCALL